MDNLYLQQIPSQACLGGTQVGQLVIGILYLIFNTIRDIGRSCFSTKGRHFLSNSSNHQLPCFIVHPSGGHP